MLPTVKVQRLAEQVVTSLVKHSVAGEIYHVQDEENELFPKLRSASLRGAVALRSRSLSS